MPISMPIRSISCMAPPLRWGAHQTRWRHDAQRLGHVVLSSSSKLDALLRTDTLDVQQVLDLTHRGDEGRILGGLISCVTTGLLRSTVSLAHRGTGHTG